LLNPFISVVKVVILIEWVALTKCHLPGHVTSTFKILDPIGVREGRIDISDTLQGPASNHVITVDPGHNLGIRYRKPLLNAWAFSQSVSLIPVSD
jgi:hypothetical protein